MTEIFKVVQQGEALAVQSRTSETGQTLRCTLVLQEIGGKYADQYVCTMLGTMAECRFYNGDMVVASLRFTAHEHGGAFYQDVMVNEIVKINH